MRAMSWLMAARLVAPPRLSLAISLRNTSTRRASLAERPPFEMRRCRSSACWRLSGVGGPVRILSMRKSIAWSRV